MKDFLAAVDRPRSLSTAIRFRRVWVVLTAVSVAACSGATADDRANPTVGTAPIVIAQADMESIPEPNSSAGGYLAARHARLENDTEAALRYYSWALEGDPKNPEILVNALMAALSERELETAGELAERLIAVEEKSPVGRLTMSVVAARNADWANVPLSDDGDATSGLFRFLIPLIAAWAETAQGNYDAAIAALDPLAETSAFASTGDFHAGLISEFFTRRSAAENGYAGALSALRGGSYRVVTAAGGFYHREGRIDEARAIYDGFLDQNPDTTFLDNQYRRLDAGDPPPPLVANGGEGMAEAFYGVAISLYQESAVGSALIYVQMAIGLRPDFDAAQMLLGDILTAQSRLDKAGESYQSVNDDSALKWAVRLRTANALAELERIDDAAEEFRLMAIERPGRTDPLISLADMFRRDERYLEAIDAYDQAFARIPTLEKRHWTLLYARGMSLERAKLWERAETDFLRALELEPDQPLVLNYLGYSWVEMGMNLSRARAMIETAVEQRPNDGYIVDSLGWVLYRLGEFEEAARFLERAAELRPIDPVILDHFGDGLWRVDRRDEARFQWQRALSFDPEEELAVAISEKLENGLPDESEDGLIDLEDL